MLLYRVIRHQAGVRDREPGGALYVPPQGSGRLDNPDLYGVLYTSENRVGCVVEAFARYPVWEASLFVGAARIPSVRALATYEVDAERYAVFDLDNPRMLVQRSLRPSDIITRDYRDTRKWARAIYNERRWNGVRWWSYYEARWANVGLWDLLGVKVWSVEPLSVDHDAVIAAAAALKRRNLVTDADVESKREARPSPQRRRT